MFLTALGRAENWGSVLFFFRSSRPFIFTFLFLGFDSVAHFKGDFPIILLGVKTAEEMPPPDEAVEERDPTPVEVDAGRDSVEKSDEEIPTPVEGKEGRDPFKPPVEEIPTPVEVEVDPLRKHVEEISAVVDDEKEPPEKPVVEISTLAELEAANVSLKLPAKELPKSAEVDTGGGRGSLATYPSPVGVVSAPVTKGAFSLVGMAFKLWLGFISMLNSVHYTEYQKEVPFSV